MTIRLRQSPARLLIRALAGGAAALLCAGAAAAQETGSLDSLLLQYLSREPAASAPAPAAALRQADPDLGLMLERELIAGQPGQFSYYTLGGFWRRTQAQGLADLWRRNNAAFLAKPAAQRTGEGLIPDIQIPLPVLGGMLGSGAEIKLNGLEKITVGGQQTVYPNSNTAFSSAQSTNNFDLKIKQDTKVNLEGVVGDRVHVLIDYDSQIETEKKSKVRLRYDGKEDEVLQSLEAGDTEFSLSGSGLVGGLTTVHKGLFGVKAVAKLAGLELTAIASKDEGQSQSTSFSGQNHQDSVVIDDVNYIKHRFFNLDPCIDRANGDSIVQLRVFVRQSNTGAQTNSFRVNAINHSRQHFMAWDSTTIEHDVRVEEKNPTEFFTFAEPQLNPRPNYLYLRQGLQDDDLLGVAFKVRKRNGDTLWVPDASILVPDTIHEKNILLIKRTNSQPPDSSGGYDWDYELRNFYDLRASQIVGTTLSVKLQKSTDNSTFLENDSLSGKSFLYLVGLDENNDGRIDDNWVKLGDDCYFFLPMERPFNDSIPGHRYLPERNPIIYSKVNPDHSLSKYRFLARYLSSNTSFILPAPGKIIEGSVKVTLNGVTIDPSKYRIDYDIPEIEFTDPATKDQIKQSSSQLKIDYQYLPTFALGSKTLIGVRGVYKFSDKATLGGTWLYRSEQTPEDRPRLGEEPRRIIVAGLDGSVETNPEFLTRAANLLPLVETEAQSSVKVAGELAENFPNPNTKGQVYIDDMDGAKQSDGLILDRRYWVRSSAPVAKYDPNTGLRKDTLLADQCYWFNPTVKPTQGEINPEMTDEKAKKDLVSTMRLVVAPHGNDTASWGGITTLLSKTGMDFTERTVLNVWVKGRNGRLHLDIGKNISEDQVRRTAGGFHPADGVYNSEPLGPNDQQVHTNSNDVGIDNTQGADGQHVAGDDGNDDYDPNDVTKVDGTENNGQFDTEDLKLSGKRNGDYLVAANDYYTCSFRLDSMDANAYGWHKYAIPLSSLAKVGYPYNWNDIYYSRLWVDGLDHKDSVELALAEVGGNIWLEQSIAQRDSASPTPVAADSEKLVISTKNNRDDADYSRNPPYDPGTDENGNVKFEQSLVFNIYKLKPGHLALARKSLRSGENNYTGYQTLQFYVHGDPTGQDTFLIRLVAGSDTNSYYQYRAVTTAGWQNVAIPLDRFSDLKKPPYQGHREDGAYAVKGNPSLTNLSRIALGVVNGRGSPYSDKAEIWFDDLRLTDVRKDGGTAFWTTVDLRLADLLTLSGGYRQTGAHWYTMNDQGRGSGVKTTSYNFSSSLSLSKFYLDRLGFNLPLSFGQTVSEGFPEFGNDDIRLTPEESRANKSWSRGRTVSYSLNRTKPTNWWLTDLLIQPLNYGGSWSQTVSFDQNSADSNVSFSQHLGYGYSPRSRGLKLVKGITLYYLPSNFGVQWAGGQTRQWHWDKLTNVINTQGSGMARSLSSSLAWKLTDQLNYSFSQSRDLMQKKWQGDPRTPDGWLIHRLGLGSELSRNQRVDFNTTLSWLKVVKPTVSYNTTYNETHSIILAAGNSDSTNVQSVTNTNGLTVANDFPVGEWLAKVTALRNPARDTAAEAGSPRWMLMHLESFLKNWQGVQFNFTQSKNSATTGLRSRPNLWYQLGWQRLPRGIERFGPSADNLSLANSYSANSQARLGPASITGSWGRTDSWTTVGGATNYSRTDNWPTLRADVMSVEKLWPQALTSSRLATSYSLTHERNWQQDRGLSRDAIRKNFSPLAEWSASWRPKFSTSLSYDWQIADLREPSPQYISGWRRDYSETKKLSGSFSYAFTAEKGFSFKLWKLGRKRFKFSNELRMSLTGSYSVRTQKYLDALAAVADAPYFADTEELGVNTSAEYRFTNSITGSMSAEYGTTKNRINSVSDSKRYGLNLLVNIVF